MMARPSWSGWMRRTICESSLCRRAATWRRCSTASAQASQRCVWCALRIQGCQMCEIQGTILQRNVKKKCAKQTMALGLIAFECSQFGSLLKILCKMALQKQLQNSPPTLQLLSQHKLKTFGPLPHCFLWPLQIETLFKDKGHEFMWNEHLGYVLTCPSNLGTGLRAGVHVKLPNMSKHEKFSDVLKRLRLQKRGTGMYIFNTPTLLGNVDGKFCLAVIGLSEHRADLVYCPRIVSLRLLY